jgi:hypothetical protein
LPVHAVLSCKDGVAAAEGALGPAPDLVSIEFHYIAKCPPGVYCAAYGTTRDGFVIFRFTGPRPDLWVEVHADEAGRITATSPEPLPSPSS